MNRRFENKAVIVTGGASGIGAAACRLFAREGGRVVVADVQVDKGEAVAAGIRATGGEAIFVRTDVSKSQDCRAMVEAAVSAFGGLHVAFNNAGVVSSGLPLAEEDDTTWERVTGVNLRGVFSSMKYEIPAMIACGGGTIVNTSSVAGVLGEANAAAYTAAKHGVIGLTRAAALDYIAKGVRINCVCPGGTDTDMLAAWVANPQMKAQIIAGHPIGRLAAPEELAEVALFLASEQSSFVVGQAWLADGGVTVR